MNTAHIFLDTNTALHFQRPDHIDWCALTGSKRVVLVGAPILCRELEVQKIHNPSRKLRERAGAYIKWLVQFVRDPAVEVRPGTTWHFIPVEPAIDFPENNLSAGIADDQLIASVLTYAPEENPSIYVATADINLEIKLRHRKITPFLLPDTLKLPGEPDPLEKEVQNLRRQVAQRRLPTLALVTEMDGDRCPMTLAPPVTAPSAKPMDQVRREHTPLILPETSPEKKPQTMASLYHLDAAAMRSALLTSERVSRYNEELNTFLSEYQEYLDELLEWEEQAALTVKIQLILDNTGTAPGSDIDIIIHFPDDLILIDEDDLPSRPKQPRPPNRPDRIPDVRELTSFSGHDYLRSPLLDLQTPNVHSSASVASEDHRVSFWSRNLKHGFTDKYDPVYFRFPDRQAVRQFHVEYEISAAELPEPITGKLHFIIPKADAPEAKAE